MTREPREPGDGYPLPPGEHDPRFIEPSALWLEAYDAADGNRDDMFNWMEAQYHAALAAHPSDCSCSICLHRLGVPQLEARVAAFCDEGIPRTHLQTTIATVRQHPRGSNWWVDAAYTLIAEIERLR